MILRAVLLSFFGILAFSLPIQAEPSSGSVKFDFALYFSPDPSTDPETRLTALLAGEFQKLGTIATVDHRWEKTEDYAPPTPDAFRYRTVDLKAEQGAVIAKSKRVLVLTFSAAPTRLLETNRLAEALLARLAEDTAGLPWDEECRFLYSIAAWRKRRVDAWQGNIPDVRGEITIDAYRNPELVRVITLGMRKFGLPDLVFSEVASSTTRPAGNLVNACAQRMLEGQRPEKERFKLVLSEIKHDRMRASAIENPYPGATGKLIFNLLPTSREEGDPANTLWIIECPYAPGASRMERQSSALASLFGSKDEMVGAKAGDPEMLAAGEKARKAFFAAAPEYRKGLQANEHLIVKTGFKIGDQTEYMWAEVIHWNIASLDCILVNDSNFDKTLREGRRITVALKDVYDYIHSKPDGSSEGNETGKVLQSRESK